MSVLALAKPLHQRDEPSYPSLPQTNQYGETTVSGLFVVGEVAGTPLLKLGLNAGVDVIDRIAPSVPAGTSDIVSVLIVGAGASGLAAAMRAKELGVSCRVLEANIIAHTVVNMYAGKRLFAEPLSVKNRSSLWFDACTREQLLKRWHAQLADATIDVREHTRVTDVVKEGAVFVVKTASGVHRAHRVVLALGKSGAPRALGVPGEQEHGDKVHHAMPDATAYDAQRVVVVGGGDVACEAAIALAQRARVAMIVRGDLGAAKRQNASAVQALAASGAITLHLGASISAIDQAQVTFTANGTTTRIDNDHVLLLIGTELPVGFFRRAGLRLAGEWHWRRYASASAMFVFAYTLYALKKFPDTPYAWPFTTFIDPDAFRRAVGALFAVAFSPFRWLFDDAARVQIDATLWFQQGYLYSLTYTLLMAGFGWQALMRWSGIAKSPRYQRYRYASLLTFQLVFFLITNVIAVQGLSIQYAWRAWGLYQPWPLFFNTFHWWNSSDPHALIALFVGGGLLGTFVIIPLLARNHGKRFCTWVCGCGGLAETLGDRWRHLAPKGERSRAWEFQSFIVLVAALLVTVITVGAFGTRADNAWAQGYSYVVDFWLVAVIPIALYPFFGGKVWCRYWCPLAAWNQILARWYGRLHIKSTDACITCGECSKQCQVGVDVMAFARKQQPFDNSNSACIHCGICIDVCPMDVLSFDLLDVGAKGRALPVVQ